MSNIAHELFLLSTNLSQFKSKVLITKVFIESLNSIFFKQDFEWKDSDAVCVEPYIKVCTLTKTYGYIKYTQHDYFSDETFSLFQNAVQLVGIYLEKLEQESLLKNQKEHLGYLVEEKTQQLRDYQKELEDKKAEIEQQNTEFKKRNFFIETVLDNLPIGLAANNIETNFAFYINKKLEEIYGWPKEEINSLDTFFKNVYPDDEYREKIMTQIINDIQSGDPSRMHWENIEITTSDGTKKYINAVNIPLFDQNTMVSTVMDVTDLNKKNQEYESLNEELRQTNEELYTAKEKAEESSRLKTEFLNNMSHEVRTPMNGIMGFSELLDDPGISDEKRRYYTKIIQNSSQQLLRIIDDILEISTLETRQQSLNEESFCLNDLLMDLFSIYNLKSKERNIPIYLKKGATDAQSHIISDKTKLNRILGNLIENALKFTSSGFIEVGYSIEGQNLNLYVKDTGIGISPENFESIFERFSQEEKELSNKKSGLGLGLSISRGNAKLLGGNITVKSEKGKGSIFYVTIPYKTDNQNEFIPQEAPKKNNRKFAILVAEDEEVNYLYIETLFEIENSDNYKIIHAKNGKEAVDICLQDKNIDLVLMDIKMPLMNGHEATEKIKEVYPKLPIIAQTAYSTEADRKLALKHGCDEFISKPLNNKKLFGLINKYLK